MNTLVMALINDATADLSLETVTITKQLRNSNGDFKATSKRVNVLQVG